MKTPEEIQLLIKESIDRIVNCNSHPFTERDFLTNLLREGNKQEFNRALELAAEKAKTKKAGNSGSWYDASVDKESILSLKIT